MPNPEAKKREDFSTMSDDLKAEFRHYRAEILRGLVQIAGAERVRVRPVQGQDQGPTPEERIGRLESAFPDLSDCLSRLSERLGKLPVGLVTVLSGKTPDRDEMVRKTVAARKEIERLRQAVRDMEVNSGKVEPDRIDQIAKDASIPLIEIVNEWFPIPKIFVAVHGIGDQFQNETVQTVAFRVCDYVGQPTAIPLGRFRSPGARVGVFLPEPGRDPNLDCGFAEIYWADVPRVPAAEKYILEEPRKWARTLVERLRLKSLDTGSLQPRDRVSDERVEELLEEMIQGVTVADRIAFLAEKAGLFRFDLKKILNDFLNDVQVVTEFEDYRKQLLQIFAVVMERIFIYFPASEIYIVAHSEGTVVSFMGLLFGLHKPAEWAKMVRGYMTIGSPLNKHVFFWPELFDQFKANEANLALQGQPIAWKNYYDYGDPIGYDLGPTRNWLEKSGWAPFFKFKNEDDIGFTRYNFPGEAHNQYWRDPEVFGHFIQEVVDPTNQALKSRRKAPYVKPGTRWFPWLVSYPMPYFLAAGLLFLACYLLYKAVRGCLDPIGARFESPQEILLNVLAVWGLITGMSLLARIPRLGAHPAWWVLAVVLGIGFTLLYFGLSGPNRGSIQRFLGGSEGDGALSNPYNVGLMVAAGSMFLTAVLLKALRPIAWTLVPVVLWIVLLRVVFAPWAGAREPALGWLPLGWLAVSSAVLAPVLWALVRSANRLAPRRIAEALIPLKAVAWVLGALAFWFAVPLALTALLPEWGVEVMSLPLRGMAVLSIAWAIGLIAWGVSWYNPGIGTRPLIHAGGLIILLVVVTQLIYHPTPVPASERVTVAKAAHWIAAEVVQRRMKDLSKVEDQFEGEHRVPPRPYDLLLIPSLSNDDGIPKKEEGRKDLIVVAVVNQVFHFRVFDDRGEVSDFDESSLKEKAPQIANLTRQLQPLWPPHELTRADKDRVITTVASILGSIPPISTEYPIPREEWPLVLDAAALNEAVDESLEQGPIWPVFLAGAAFLYVWWLAVITFDLTFVWHLYIRWSGAQKLVIQHLKQAGALPT